MSQILSRVVPREVLVVCPRTDMVNRFIFRGVNVVECACGYYPISCVQWCSVVART